jgi:hypothetical protein
MSQNVFLIDPIFFMPIDEEYSKRKGKHKKDDITKSQKIKNIIGLEQNKDLNIIKGNHSKKIISFPEENKSPSINSQDDNKTTIIFSSIKNDRNIKSMSNSSKIYISEIFKRNWKLKTRRLIAKLKKKLIKQWTQTNYKEINDINANLSKYYSNNKLIINSQSNNINTNDYEFNNYYIYENNINNNNTLITNNFNHINDNVNLKNSCKNNKIGYTNNNKNLNVSSNLVFNFNKIHNLNLNFNFIGKEF